MMNYKDSFVEKILMTRDLLCARLLRCAPAFGKNRNPVCLRRAPARQNCDGRETCTDPESARLLTGTETVTRYLRRDATHTFGEI